MQTNEPIWTSEPLYLTDGICIDIRTDGRRVRLGCISGEHVVLLDINLTFDQSATLEAALNEARRRGQAAHR